MVFDRGGRVAFTYHEDDAKAAVLLDDLEGDGHRLWPCDVTDADRVGKSLGGERYIQHPGPRGEGMDEPSGPNRFDVGDRVRIDIPDETRPDHKHHGRNGEIIAVIPVGEGAAEATGRFRVELDTGGAVDVGPQDLRPPI